MNKKEFLEIVSETYKACKEFWEITNLPNEINEDFIIAGNKSNLSSLDLVSFLAELETNLLKQNINISFLDHLIELTDEHIDVNKLFEILEK